MQLRVLDQRKTFFGVSLFLIFFSVFMIFFGNVSLGIDMTGGTQSEYRYNNYEYDSPTINTTIDGIQENYKGDLSFLNTFRSYKISGENTFIIEAGFSQGGDEKALDAQKIFLRDTITKELGQLGDIELAKYTNIGASFGDYIKSTARLTLILAIVAISLYIAFAFSGSVGGIPPVSFALVTVITLAHDVVISSGFFLLTSSFLPQFQVNTFFITALLTILGYSINDTIVIFDRIRTNLKEYGGKTKDIKEIVESSIQQSYTRSIYTSLTLIFVLVCMLFIGPDSIGGFTLTMLYGTIIGTFSSLFIAAPLFYEIHKNATLSVYVKREDMSEEDKIVV